jgi:hypothetical protein
LPITKFLRRRRRRRSLDESNANVINGTALPQGLFEDFEETFGDDFFSDDLGYTAVEEGQGSGFDPMLSIPEDIYCSIVNDLDEACWEINPAEMWSFDRSQINNLTQNDIIRVINHQLIR